MQSKNYFFNTAKYLKHNLQYYTKLIQTITLLLITVPGVTMANQLQQQNIYPPKAKKIKKELVTHNHKRVDNYYWLNNKKDKNVIDYLEAENEYTNVNMSHAKGLQKQLFDEIKNRIKQTDTSVPYKYKNYLYYTKMEDGQEYPIYCRKKVNASTEEIILDVNKLAKEYDYFNVGSFDISENENLVAYTVDTKGNRVYDIYFKDLSTGKLLTDKISSVTSNIAWANDNSTLYYASKDSITLRSNKIYRHILGKDQTQDQLIFDEKDDTFSAYVEKSRSNQYMLIASIQSVSTEYHYLSANDNEDELKLFAPREREHEYYIDHINDKFYIKTNFNAKNFRLMQASIDKTSKEHWDDVLKYDKDYLLESFELFNNFIVIEERYNGLLQFKVLDTKTNASHYIKFPETSYSAWIAENEEPDTNLFRFGYTSLSTPASVFDYNMQTKEKTLLKEKEILGGFDKNNYQTKRVFATAKDGTKVPISLVYNKNLFNKKTGNPLLLYGYGSYGHSIDPSFNPMRLSLLDRGIVFAIAHIRGGEDLGRQWYDDGKLLKKKNTFTDFIDCAEFLITENYTSPNQLFAMGGSAGGLLMGAIINMRPELFKGIVAAVPFVDVVTTMLDDTIPLTTGEYDEWGNPNNKEYYNYILSYSPYDNVKPQNYPNILVTTGINDSQVHYWEPAKWVAKLRELKTDNNKLLFKIYMDSGHAGASGRYKAYEEAAFDYAFILDVLGINYP